MVTQERAPALIRDTGLSDLEAELEQLAMNARRSP
jgi:hypothetical protein